ncbi:phosphatase PAP2 family protein [Chitinophaga sp. Cy-1792]|uniref:phosphatase PAP2 family protein n=1 Tax=Chitinophaga sp. Cy-1792 TaxID=2608339 RepID=UPI0014215726|nr:phosphatase PAP2 family protein [Chitinophaga sp. Cy-1792]NIG56168.1 phosphatase PAP2 family protein [Chitinophaga sp. Cy-1792]
MTRIKEVLKELRLLLWLFIPVFTAMLLIKILYSREDIYFYINSLHTPAGDWFFPKITELGSTGAAVALVAILFFINKRQSFVMATAYLFTAVVNFAFKFIVAFPRPHRYFEQQLRAGTKDPRLHNIYYVPGIDVLDNFRSFPSGHTVCAFTAATVLSYYCRNKTWTILFFVLAALTGYSRMYMSQHFFEDVTAGSFTGIFLSICWLALVHDRGFGAGTGHLRP